MVHTQHQSEMSDLRSEMSSIQLEHNNKLSAIFSAAVLEACDAVCKKLGVSHEHHTSEEPFEPEDLDASRCRATPRTTTSVFLNCDDHADITRAVEAVVKGVERGLQGSIGSALLGDCTDWKGGDGSVSFGPVQTYGTVTVTREWHFGGGHRVTCVVLGTVSHAGDGEAKHLPRRTSRADASGGCEPQATGVGARDAPVDHKPRSYIRAGCWISHRLPRDLIEPIPSKQEIMLSRWRRKQALRERDVLAERLYVARKVSAAADAEAKVAHDAYVSADDKFSDLESAALDADMHELHCTSAECVPRRYQREEAPTAAAAAADVKVTGGARGAVLESGDGACPEPR